MAENLENRISSTQAKDAIFKAHSIQSSASEIDLAVGTVLNKTDYNNLYIRTMYYTKGNRTSTNTNVIPASKTTSKTLTVSILSDIDSFNENDNYSIVVKYTNGIYKSYIVDNTNKATGVVTVDRNLEDYNIDSIQMMHDSPTGQHLTGYGYAGLSQYIFNEIKQEKNIKNVVWKFNPYECKTSTSWSDSNIYLLDGSLFLTVTKLGGATGGGYVPNTDNTLNSSIGISNLNPDSSSSQRKRYQCRLGTKGQGVSFAIPMGVDGYIELGLGLKYDQSYTLGGLTKYTRGSVSIKLYDNNNTEIYSRSITGSLENIVMPITSNIPSGKISITLESSVPTIFSISEIIVWEGTITNKSLKNKSIGLIGDSWTQYPLTSTEYPSKPLRPYDGLRAEGYQFLSKKLEEYSLFKNEIVTTRNYGRGGQTSEWGKYWIKNLKEDSLDYGLCLFYTNDNNSINSFTSGVVSTYDFSPNNAYLQLNSNSGGVFGSVNYDLWLMNIANIKNQINAIGAKAIILTPSHTSSHAQTSSHMDMYGMFIKHFI